MGEFAFILAAVVALVCAGYLLVRYEILDVRDAAAGSGLIAAVVLIWRMLTKQHPNNIQTTSKQATKPHVTEDEIDEILREKPEPAAAPDGDSDVSSDDPRDWDI